jgi:hypothetical protein
MIQVKPVEDKLLPCTCGENLKVIELVWQGMHICEKAVCNNCKNTRLFSIPVNQACIEQYSYDPGKNLLYDESENLIKGNWFSSRLRSISNPSTKPVDIIFEKFERKDEVIILNTLDYIYGHSFLFLMNLQRILKAKQELGVIVIIQPMFRWMLPTTGLAEIWTVNLGFRDFYDFHKDLSDKINIELNRFRKVWLSKGHILPTNENIDINLFTGILPYDFRNKPYKPRITFIWREDPDRLWIRNILIVKVFKKLGISNILLPFHISRTKRFISSIRIRMGDGYVCTLAGFGKSGKFNRNVDDRRVAIFDSDAEKLQCRIYSESELVIGVHGSSMILPSLHSGMAISMMPSRRWGNYAEDLCFRETDPRLASFHRRVIPLNLSLSETCDIVEDMLKGRDSFFKKFVHSDEL